jgi:hypothetical protein
MVRSLALLVALTGCCSLKQQCPAPTTSHVDAKALADFATQRPTDAKAFGGHWYKTFDQDVCWHTAKAACEKMGGHLVCIETKEEQAFIAKLAEGRYFYLGATDEAKEDSWVWVNGAKWDYTCWMSGQPNNYGGDENFLATYDDGDWVDVADEGSGFWMPKGFICEWDK